MNGLEITKLFLDLLQLIMSDLYQSLSCCVGARNSRSSQVRSESCTNFLQPEHSHIRARCALCHVMQWAMRFEIEFISSVANVLVRDRILVYHLALKHTESHYNLRRVSIIGHVNTRTFFPILTVGHHGVRMFRLLLLCHRIVSTFPNNESFALCIVFLQLILLLENS